jgi:hypothetical protein
MDSEAEAQARPPHPARIRVYPPTSRDSAQYTEVVHLGLVRPLVRVSIVQSYLSV